MLSIAEANGVITDAFPSASNFLRFFQESQGWTLQALFAILRDLRDLAIDVRLLLA